MKIKDCSECVTFFLDNYDNLMEACASVGISRNKGTNEMLIIYLSSYHSGGHRELGRHGEEEAPAQAAV